MSRKKSKDRCKKGVQNRQNIQHQVSLNYISFKSPIGRELEGGRTFTVTTCKLWNSLPLTIRKLTTLSSFKKSFWKNIFNNQQVLNYFTL